MVSSRRDSMIGIIVACTIMLMWCLHLGVALSQDIRVLPIAQIIAHIAVQTFLFTGLFITAHDAMHGAICRHYRRLNHALGIVSVRLYALFSYRTLWQKHWEHHRHVATPRKDPDFHDGNHRGFLRWYLRFLLTYIGWKQVAGMAIIFNILLHVFHVPLGSILGFWVLPSLLSTVQLFYFGTYVPHKDPEPHEPNVEYSNRHRSRTSMLPTWLSFLTCYHFGYHYEHHEFPSVPWWQLPRKHREYLRNLPQE
ncbi:MAG: fatty acid desaturase [Bacteroidota bacterium]|nr:fatty acid desaturase [Candidatus Kapabacteria bacterium]MDW8220591.1 fatty acid desaturase [Bacteroidota bacterium]